MALAAVVAAFAHALRRATELFALRVEHGTVEVVRGRLPPRLLDEVGDVLRRSGVRSATIRAVVDGGAARVVATGLGEGDLQAVRNVVGTFRLSQIRAGQRTSRD